MNHHSKLTLAVLAVAGILGFNHVASAQTTAPCAPKWEEVDKNKDGKITIDEANNDLKVKFTDVDKNGDGALSPEEYEACQKA